MVDPSQIKRTIPPNVFNVQNMFKKSLVVAAKLEQNIQEQLQAKAQIIGDKYADGSLAREDDRRKWSFVEDDIGEAVRDIDAALFAFDSLDMLLPQMKEIVAKAEKEEDEAKRNAYAQTFQAYIRSAESTVRNAAGRTPLFRKDGGELRYRASPKGAEQVEFGRDFSAGYTLEKGNVSWVSNRRTNTMDEFIDGESTRRNIFIRSSMRLDAQNEDGTINFSTAVTTAAIESHTEFEIKRGAFKVLDAWVYENFQTEDGQKRAQDDIEATSRYITFERSRIETMRLTADFYKSRARAAVKEIDRENQKLAEQQAEDIKKIRDEAMMRAQLLLRNVMRSEQQARNYALAFKKDGFKQSGGIFGTIMKMQV